MDKETLSNYGWIVVMILVLVCLLAMATPFGDYIKTAIETTTQGLYDTNTNALKSTGLIDFNSNDKPADTKPAEPIIRSGIIPDGATYTISKTNTTLEGNGENTFPKFPDTYFDGDTYKEGDYYYYCNGSYWYATVRSDRTDKTALGEILTEINGKEIQSLDNCFKNCYNLQTAPAIPSTVKTMAFTFAYCKSLTTAPAIPSGVTSMMDTFIGCTNLKTAPVIPSGVTEMSGTFQDCTSLTTAPAIPSGVTSMLSTFEGCTSLTAAPAIPSTVTGMIQTFENCTSLKTAPTIPSGVKNMNSTFWNCTALTGTIEINANPTSYDYCFYGTEKPITLTGTSTKLTELATTANGNITIQ